MSFDESNETIPVIKVGCLITSIDFPGELGIVTGVEFDDHDRGTYCWAIWGKPDDWFQTKNSKRTLDEHVTLVYDPRQVGTIMDDEKFLPLLISLQRQMGEAQFKMAIYMTLAHAEQEALNQVRALYKQIVDEQATAIPALIELLPKVDAIIANIEQRKRIMEAEIERRHQLGFDA